MNLSEAIENAPVVDVYEFLNYCEAQRNSRFPALRQGQMRMNLLYFIRPDLYQKAVDAGLDVFYSDQQLVNFDSFLMENW